jgi:hypothetical protein
VRVDPAHPFLLTGDAMKLLLIAGVALLSLLLASADKVGPPIAGDNFAWAAGIPIHSPR